ncbi:MAG TPA: hypothetical protein VF598_03430, partial [Hymenobacter sp.]
MVEKVCLNNCSISAALLDYWSAKRLGSPTKEGSKSNLPKNNITEYQALRTLPADARHLRVGEKTSVQPSRRFILLVYLFNLLPRKARQYDLFGIHRSSTKDFLLSKARGDEP